MYVANNNFIRLNHKQRLAHNDDTNKEYVNTRK